MIGTRLAHYEITSHLGSGGMGDVYQATDSKLGRRVAVKFLSESFAHDAERVARFEREARVLASLNHPSIAGIYGLEDANGKKFLVMELVPGETLAERIARDPIPLDEALRITASICEALEAAHEKGVVHRDLKPANVKLTPDGKVKVLDFGLAKALESGPENSALSNSPTLSMAATNAGVVLGTAAYMSPEQAKGQQLDRRSDIFALGCVLYEMLIGKATFEGDSVVEILSSVVKTEPNWSALPENTPRGIQTLLRRCLQKDRSRRLRDAADAKFQIEEALQAPESPPVTAAKRNTRGQFFVWAAALVIAMIVASAITAYFYRSTIRQVSELRLDISTPPLGDVWVALSPDGKMVVYEAVTQGKRQLWVRSLESATARPITGTEGGIYFFWSPDSRSLGFFAEGKLKRIDIDGGPAQTLADAPEARGGAWGADGTIIFTREINAPLYSVRSTGGESTPLTHLESKGETGHRFPSFLPGGRQFLYSSVFNSEEGRYAVLNVGSLDGKTSKPLFKSADSRAVYVAPGFLLFLRDHTLMAQRFDLTALQVVGDAFRVADQLVSSWNTYSAAITASDNGTIAFRTGLPARSRLVWFDVSGKEISGVIPVVSSAFNPMLPNLSPDGKRVAVTESATANVSVWLIELARGVTTRLVPTSGASEYGIWAPGGDTLALSYDIKGNFDLFETSDKSGSPVPRVVNPGTTMPSDWSSDGRYILYTQLDPKGGYDIWALPTFGERKPTPVANGKFDEVGGKFSRDMNWIAYQSNESGRFEIVAQPFPGPGPKTQLSVGGGRMPRWRADGKEMFYVSATNTIVRVPISYSAVGKTIEAGKAVPVTDRVSSKAFTGAELPGYDVTPDGQRFLVEVPTEETVLPITVILNWKPSPQ